MADEEKQDEKPQDEKPQDEKPQDDGPQAPDPSPQDEGADAPEAPPEEAPAAKEEPPAAKEEPPAEATAPAEEATPAAPERPKRKKADKKAEPEVIPGAHLEPDLVLDEAAQERGAVGEQTAAEIQAAEDALAAEEGDGASPAEEPSPAPSTVLELAADARYQATGKRKTAVARVTLKPGTGDYTVNGRALAQFFPRPTLQTIARGPLETAGQHERMDVVAKIHGGGMSSQAGALRHGIARALVEADPALRGELKRRGYLTRDPRVKERKKAGLKKARKRPQFSKR